MIKVVFDTNIYISAFLGGRTIKRLFRYWEQGAYDLYVSEPILREIERVLTYPRISQKPLAFAF